MIIYTVCCAFMMTSSLKPCLKSNNAEHVKVRRTCATLIKTLEKADITGQTEEEHPDILLDAPETSREEYKDGQKYFCKGPTN